MATISVEFKSGWKARMRRGGKGQFYGTFVQPNVGVGGNRTRIDSRSDCTVAF